MFGRKVKYRFESEVHLGLLSIILVLVLMSLVSNFVLFRARVHQQENTASRLRAAAVSITRTIRENNLTFLTPGDREQFRTRLELSSLVVVPSVLPDGTAEERARWLGSVVQQMPSDQIPEIVDHLLTADLKRLTRGEGSQFFMVTPVTLGLQKQLLILSTENPNLAYLQDSGKVILWVGFGATLLVALVYFTLSRSIFRPFRRIKEEAVRAGRPVLETENEADLVVEEYKQIIADLQDKEAELLRLNAAIQSRADSLEQFNEYLLTSIDSGIITVDEDCCVKSVNEVAAALLAGSVSELVGKPIDSVFGGESVVGQFLRLVLRGVPIPEYKEVTYIRRDNSIAILGAAVSAIKDDTGRVIGASLLLNDLTEVTQLRRQVEQKNRLEALGEMAAGLAHQLRNSVGAISGFGNLIKRRLVKSEQQTDLAESLLKEAKEAGDLIAKFLAFARPLKPQFETLSLASMLQEIVAGIAANPACEHIQFHLRAASEARISGDTLLLKQAIVNLLDNAVNAYDGRAGRVEIDLKAENETSCIVIRDFGCGIAADKLDKIFTPFYSSRPSGTGLGLPFTSRIVDLHGGQITVDSRPGSGTAVTVTLPVEPSFHMV